MQWNECVSTNTSAVAQQVVVCISNKCPFVIAIFKADCVHNLYDKREKRSGGERAGTQYTMFAADVAVSPAEKETKEHRECHEYLFIFALENA